ncbi:MAG: 3-isopropylmalate dehydratase small subunit [Methanobacteriota archaeon]|nr:MAG: 3-isopropylmalate dehydratase small subunit [Euryarchaeota archaeon]
MIKGKAWKYGDDINTDVIFPGRYLALTDPEEMAKHAMEDLDSDFVNKVQEGDIVVAGRFFGCGSSREQAVTCLKYAGVSAIVAVSFARLFFRNAVNLGMPVIQLPDTKRMESGQELEIDVEGGNMKIVDTNEVLEFKPLPEFILKIIDDGGLVPNLKKKLDL